MKTLRNTTIFCLALVAFIAMGFDASTNKTIDMPTPTGILKGKITDKESGEPLPFVRVEITKPSTGTPIGTISDIDGNYEIKYLSPGKVDVKYTFLGFEELVMHDVVIKTDEITFMNAKLKSASVQLDELVIMHDVEEEISLESIMHYDMAASEIRSISSKENKSSSMRKNRVKKYEYDARMIMPAGGYFNNQDGDGLDREAYDHIQENQFRQVSDEPLSTFSIDVDAASYANVRRFINNGQTPPTSFASSRNATAGN